MNFGGQGDMCLKTMGKSIQGNPPTFITPVIILFKCWNL